MWASIASQQYDRAAKIANTAGPYITPDKDKPVKDSDVAGQVISLELP